jgi:hypothetical protein
VGSQAARIRSLAVEVYSMSASFHKLHAYMNSRSAIILLWRRVSLRWRRTVLLLLWWWRTVVVVAVVLLSWIVRHCD